MGRPLLKKDERKGKLGITISKELLKKISEETNNKSAFIEKLIINYFKNVIL
jgi:hypothetical protein